jgi:hypothetical protein
MPTGRKPLELASFSFPTTQFYFILLIILLFVISFDSSHQAKTKSNWFGFH